MSDRPGSDVAGASIEGTDAVFRLADPEHALAGVRLWQELGLPSEQLDFVAVDTGWELRIARPWVHRMEYLYEVSDDDGCESIPDPANHRQVNGAFGVHSVLELPGYAAPSWLSTEPVPSALEAVQVEATPLGELEVGVWAPEPADSATELPLLLAHDGAELSEYALLTHYVGALIAAGLLPPLRIALLSPVERDAWYSGSDDYTKTLVDHVLPGLTSAYASSGPPVLAGASLGAVAALHAEWRRPGTFAGLFLQSGSFFTPETDPQEEDFSGFKQVTAFVREVLDADSAPSGARLAMTCGSAEENVHNNRVMAAHLRSLDLDVDYRETPDVHNFTSWRDAFDPTLTKLLCRLWGER